MSAVRQRLARTGRIAREVLLIVAALGGVVCIVLAVLAFTGGYSLILFKTGSMSPTIPAGSVALVQTVPAAELHVGDVVTVDRAGALPITHRITGIEDGATPTERVITLRGDANPTDDPLPYTVAQVRIVRGSLPHLAPVIAQFGNPWVLGGLTVCAALLVSWAFWPRRAATAAVARPDDAGDETGRGRTASDAGSPTTGPPLRTLVTVVLAAATLGPALALAPTAPAAADSSLLVVQSDLEGAGVQPLDPVEPLDWHVGIDALAAPADGRLDVSFSSVGDPAFGLRAEVRACAAAWEADGSCPAGEQLLYARSPVPADGTWQSLWTSPTPDAVHLQIALTADPADAAAGQAGASVTVRATAAGETVDTDVDGETVLPPTGGGSFALFAAPAALLVGVGAALVARKRSIRRIRP